MTPTHTLAARFPLSAPAIAGMGKRRRALRGVAVILAFAMSGLAQAVGMVDFSPGLLASVRQRFGDPAVLRLRNWQDMVRRLEGGGEGIPVPGSLREAELLRVVNDFFNRVPHATDQERWGCPDYWATPVELLAVNGGDGKNHAIAKYLTLKELGVPPERLRIVYVRSVVLDMPHMVLAYYPSPEGDPLILDNVVTAVRRASYRNDLVPVYQFNDDDVKGGRAMPKRQFGESQVRQWAGLLQKLQKEQRM